MRVVANAGLAVVVCLTACSSKRVAKTTDAAGKPPAQSA
jgi:hypothetical protein